MDVLVKNMSEIRVENDRTSQKRVVNGGKIREQCMKMALGKGRGKKGIYE